MSNETIRYRPSIQFDYELDQVRHSMRRVALTPERRASVIQIVNIKAKEYFGDESRLICLALITGYNYPSTNDYPDDVLLALIELMTDNTSLDRWSRGFREQRQAVLNAKRDARRKKAEGKDDLYTPIEKDDPSGVMIF